MKGPSVKMNLGLIPSLIPILVTFFTDRISFAAPTQDDTFEKFSKRVKMDGVEFRNLILDHRVAEYKTVFAELCAILRSWSEFQQKYLQAGIKLYREISELVDVYKDACEIEDETMSIKGHPFYAFEERPHLYATLQEYCDLVRRSYKFVDKFVEPASSLYKIFLERKIKILC